MVSIYKFATYLLCGSHTGEINVHKFIHSTHEKIMRFAAAKTYKSFEKVQNSARQENGSWWRAAEWKLKETLSKYTTTTLNWIQSFQVFWFGFCSVWRSFHTVNFTVTLLAIQIRFENVSLTIVYTLVVCKQAYSKSHTKYQMQKHSKYG